MTDKELFEKFELYAKDKGLTVEQAVALIGAKRASYFNWKKGKSISKHARAAMLVLLEPDERESPSKNSLTHCALSHCPAELPVDRFLQVVLEVWEKLPTEERAQVAGLAAALSERAEKKIG